jgi:hemoglobin
MRREIYIPEAPRVEPPSKEIYMVMGEANIFKMLEEMYDELEQSTIRHMFPEDMVEASRRSAAFFVGLLGGPPMYHMLYGAPRMRARHLPFRIDEKARGEWLACFEHVLENAVEEYNFPEEHLEGFRAFLVGFSGWMVNSA